MMQFFFLKGCYEEAIIAHAIFHSIILRLMRVNPFKESARFLAAEICFGSLSSDRSRSVERSALHPKVFETRLPYHSRSRPRSETGWHCALHYSCSHSCFVAEITGPCVIQRGRIKPSYPSEIPLLLDSSHCTSLYQYPVLDAVVDRQDTGCNADREGVSFSREAKGFAKTSKGGSRHCTRGPSLAGSGSAGHTCLRGATYVPAISHTRSR